MKLVIYLKKTMKKILFIIGAILLFFTLVRFGIYGFSKVIYNSCSCERFNIDNIELRTGINIPAIKKMECNYNTTSKTKKSSFIIDTKEININDYIKRNKLEKSEDENLYVKSNDIISHSYKVILKKNSGKLDVEINYKD